MSEPTRSDVAPLVARTGGYTVSFVAQGIDRIDSTPLRRLFEYWDAKRGQSPAPDKGTIDFSDLGWVLRMLTVVQVLDGGDDYLFRAAGTGIQRFHGRDITGTRTSQLLPVAYRELLQRAYCAIVASRLPMLSLSEYRYHGEMIGAYLTIRLPVLVGGEVETILIASDYGDQPADIFGDITERMRLAEGEA